MFTDFLFSKLEECDLLASFNGNKKSYRHLQEDKNADSDGNRVFGRPSKVKDSWPF